MDWSTKTGLIMMALGLTLMLVVTIGGIEAVWGFVGGLAGVLFADLVRDIASTPNEKPKRKEIA